jgi:hypothetical protein
MDELHNFSVRVNGEFERLRNEYAQHGKAAI